MNPKEATIAVTYRCNSRCTMCNIWQIDTHDELPASEYSKLPRSLRTINITGGEPFLREDLVDVVRKVHEVSPRSRIVVSTNGFLTDRIAKKMVQIMDYHHDLGIGVSIDGIGEVHDRVRGVKGAYQKALATVEAMKEIGLKDIRIATTLTDQNADQIMSLHDLSVRLSVEFSITYAHNSEIFFNKKDNEPLARNSDLESDIYSIRDKHLRTFRPKDWFRAYHIAGIVDTSLRSGSSKKCSAGSRFFFLDPHGEVFPCIVLGRSMGNIKDCGSFDELWNSKSALEARTAVGRCRADCWMVCNVRSLILSHPWRSLVWIVRNKPRAHMRR